MKTIAVIFGGRSAEHDISIITALSSVIKPLEVTKLYKVEAIYIAKDGSWYWDEKLKDISLYQSGEIENYIKKSPKTQMQLGDGLTIIKPSQFGRSTTKKIDVVFPAMHGTHGEDGELMGLLEMANVAYVGCDMPSSAIAMDKVASKVIAQANDVLVSKYEYLLAKTFATKGDGIVSDLAESLNFPIFVKPARLGSSIGITKVTNKTELKNAIEVAAHYDDKIIAEEAVQNLIEVTVPIMGNYELIPALVEQPLSPEDGVFDFETKYMNQSKTGSKAGGSKQGSQGYSQLPADISKGLYEQSIQVAKKIYKVVGCQGIARIDLLIDGKAKKVYFNEINPLPGSLYAHNWRASGVSSVDLVTKLVNLADERWAEKQKANTSFNTNFLKQF